MSQRDETIEPGEVCVSNFYGITPLLSKEQILQLHAVGQTVEFDEGTDEMQPPKELHPVKVTNSMRGRFGIFMKNGKYYPTAHLVITRTRTGGNPDGKITCVGGEMEHGINVDPEEANRFGVVAAYMMAVERWHGTRDYQDFLKVIEDAEEERRSKRKAHGKRVARYKLNRNRGNTDWGKRFVFKKPTKN